MGKIPILTKEQTLILDWVVKDDLLRQQFYFTGGTALATYYLGHRYSEDLDFFSEKKFDTQSIFTLLSEWAKKHNFSFNARLVGPVYICMLTFPSVQVKVDFGYYPYKRLRVGKDYHGLAIDSLLDIAVNKLLTIVQRGEIKDFVDLYFLLRTFSLWDLIEGVRIKFSMELEPLLLAGNFLGVEDFDMLPKMVTPVKITELKEFFRKQAKRLGASVVKP
ncbi:nucleotidyl transferase AbiEii/AbiGii toxin family protein [Candidatus Woesebacteria bacterium]|nr:nucleotidyl transferase AbiEii/AbiGii toxin family protein [Candidatus Woesebacteria bacterium]